MNCNKIKQEKQSISEKQICREFTRRISAAFSRRTAPCRRHPPHSQADQWGASGPEARDCRRRPRIGLRRGCGRCLSGCGGRWGGAGERPIRGPPRPHCRSPWRNSTSRTHSPPNYSTSRGLCSSRRRGKRRGRRRSFFQFPNPRSRGQEKIRSERVGMGI